MFELIFEGEVVPGASVDTVKSNMQQLFKASAEQIAVMFSGQKVVLKNKLDKPTALKYQAVLKKNGAMCRIALMAGAQAPAAQQAVAPASTTAKAAAPGGVVKPPASSVPEKPEVTAGNKTESNKVADSGLSLAPVKSTFATKEPPSAPPASETGHLPLAGEKVETILAGKSLSVAPAGSTLGEHHEVEAPIFEHLDDIDIAEVGADMSTAEKLPPPPAPDVSHISVAPAGSDMGQLKKDKKVVVPDISHIKLEKNS
ncbi:MAG: hypothetical protein H7A01_12870 [Hahellaceae bacterium]|nr:hypothetical protein [Hahellaceae bacterium]MCP5209788.1 hypothetical protein [Hahellaceae bacterium]